MLFIFENQSTIPFFAAYNIKCAEVILDLQFKCYIRGR